MKHKPILNSPILPSVCTLCTKNKSLTGYWFCHRIPLQDRAAKSVNEAEGPHHVSWHCYLLAEIICFILINLTLLFLHTEDLYWLHCFKREKNFIHISLLCFLNIPFNPRPKCNIFILIKEPTFFPFVLHFLDLWRIIPSSFHAYFLFFSFLIFSSLDPSPVLPSLPHFVC